MSTGSIVALCLLAGCKEDATASPSLTRVRVITTEITDFAPAITLTGVIAARVRADLSFRINGKISERLVNPGAPVTADEVLARLDPDEQQAEVLSAEAGVKSAEALFHQTTATFERQKALLTTGNTTRREYDQAEATMRSAQAQLEQARGQLTSARDQLSYTELRAGADGIIIARSAEAGQVVTAAQPVYTLARNGPRDAVFNVHEWALANVVMDKGLAISLVSDPKVTAIGDVRQISPAVDPNNMTVTVKVALRETPPAMVLGTLVNGVGPLRQHKVVLLPWGAIFELDGKPAVWLVDPRSSTVSLKPVVFYRLNKDSIAVTGLEAGQTVVTAGVQMLRPGQKVDVVTERQP